MSLVDKLTDFVTENILEHQETVAPDDDLLLTGIVDSIGIMTLVAHIESDFGIPVPPEDVTIENFVSIRAIDAYLSQRLSRNA